MFRMLSRCRHVALVVVGVMALASRVDADDQWGVNVSLTPSWQTGPGINTLFGADRVDMHGSEIRVGFVRGVDVDSDWGLSFVSTSVAGGSSLDVDTAPCSRGTCGTFLRTVDSTRMTGFEFHQFQPFKTWRERVQLGMIGAVGLGWLHNQVAKRTVTEAGDTETLVPAGELFPPSKSVVPLVRIEVAVAGIIVPGFKVRASGGFGMPGYHTFNIAFVYLISH
jgi:hypothetical protein